MKIDRIENMKHGWFVGNFEPTSYKADFEVGYRVCQHGEKVDVHYHPKGTEINLLVDGRMAINDTLLNSGDIFIIYPYEVVHVEYLTECKLIIVKNKSLQDDKVKITGEKYENF